MDFPKSVPSIGLVGGKFVDEDPLLGTPGSLIPCQWGNAVTEELLAVIVSAGLVPDEADNTQLRTAIRAIIQGAQSTVLADTGVAGAYAAVNPWPLSALPATGYPQRVKIAHVNPGASTYAPDGLAAKPIYGLGLQPLQGGELALGVAVLVYLVQAGVNAGNGAWILMSSQGGALPVAPATKSQHAINLGQLFGGLKGLQRFTASGSFVVPDGVTTMYASGAGGGGGGAGSGSVSGVTASFSASGGGGGGDAGAFITRQAFTVIPGQTLTVVIGSGGIGGLAGAAGGTGGVGGTGGSTTVTGTGVSISLAGGIGGLGGGGVISINNAGASGGYPGGLTAQGGGTGLAPPGYGYGYGGYGGSGGSGPFGSGGGGKLTVVAIPGQAGSGYGAGGAGGSGTISSATSVGGAGGQGSAGVLFLEW